MALRVYQDSANLLIHCNHLQPILSTDVFCVPCCHSQVWSDLSTLQAYHLARVQNCTRLGPMPQSKGSVAKLLACDQMWPNGLSLEHIHTLFGTYGT